MAGGYVRSSFAPRKSKDKPKKPRPDYPLTPHASGQLCRKLFSVEPIHALTGSANVHAKAVILLAINIGMDNVTVNHRKM